PHQGKFKIPVLTRLYTPTSRFRIEVTMKRSWPLGPLGLQYFALPASGKQQQPNCVCGVVVWELGEHIGQSSCLCRVQISIPLVLWIALDTLAGIVVAPLPFDRQVEHHRQERK